MHILSEIALSLSGNDYLLPYFQREFHAPNDETEANAPGKMQTPKAGIRVIVDDAGKDADTEFDKYCSDHNLPVLEIVCPHIVCTGMKGLARNIANSIYRGTYVHIKDNDAVTSVVHGVDVARAAKTAMGTQGTYMLTDGTITSIHDLAEALSYRVQNKRIFTLPAKVAKIVYGSRFFNELTSDSVTNPTFLLAFPDFKPHVVTEYLRNHIYDDKSL